jgi:hypothetical protein
LKYIFWVWRAVKSLLPLAVCSRYVSESGWVLEEKNRTKNLGVPFLTKSKSTTKRTKSMFITM